MHSDIVNGYQLLCDAHTVLEKHRGTEIWQFVSLLMEVPYSFYSLVSENWNVLYILCRFFFWHSLSFWSIGPISMYKLSDSLVIMQCVTRFFSEIFTLRHCGPSDDDLLTSYYFWHLKTLRFLYWVFYLLCLQIFLCQMTILCQNVILSSENKKNSQIFYRHSLLLTVIRYTVLQKTTSIHWLFFHCWKLFLLRICLSVIHTEIVYQITTIPDNLMTCPCFI